MEDKKRMKALFDRYRKGIATAEEKQVIANWLAQLDASEEPLPDEQVERFAARSLQELRQRLEPSSGVKKVRTLRYWLSGAAAACLLGALSVFLVRYNGQKHLPSIIGQPLASLHNTPERSLLHLADGTDIDLEAITDSTVILDESTRIYIHGREVRYEIRGTTASMAEHTLLTAPGRRYRVVLPDSTRIWINAASAVTYPVRFREDLRMASMSGEAYFEVSRAANWPFVVKTPNERMMVRVLGTSFNIAAWQDSDTVQATLVSGSVELKTANASGRQLLKPSQKAIYSTRDHQLQVLTVNTDRETDWVYERLVFRETPMKEVLEKLSRFYNVSFEMKNKAIYQYTFTGTFEDKPLKRILDYMQLSSNIHYSILKKGKKTIVELK